VGTLFSQRALSGAENDDCENAFEARMADDRREVLERVLKRRIFLADR